MGWKHKNSKDAKNHQDAHDSVFAFRSGMSG